MQTDKAIYKPGDNVKFRVFVLDANTKPYQYGEMKVLLIHEANGRNVVAARSSNLNKMGFFESFFTIADTDNLGKWGLEVKVDDDKPQSLHSIEVSDYQLPPFEVFIEPTASQLILSYGSITAVVFAKYSFGSGMKHVKGSAVVTATTYDPTNRKPGDNAITPGKQLVSETKRLEDFKTKASVEFSMRDLSIKGGWNSLEKTIVKLEAKFEDRLTRKTVTAETFVTVYKTMTYSIETLSNEHFTPGQPYKLKIKVRTVDGSLLQNSNIQLEVLQSIYTNRCKPSSYKKNLKNELSRMEIQLDSGVGEHTIIPKNQTFSITLRISFDGAVKIQKVFSSQIPTKSNENLQLTVETKRFEL